MTTENGEMWADYRAHQQQRRRNNRFSSIALLTEKGVPFQSNDGGIHLTILAENGKVDVDFWPSTGLWRVRGSTQKNYGVMKLLKRYNKV